MTHEQQIRVLREALYLVDTVSSIGHTPLPELTMGRLGEPAALATPLRPRLSTLLDLLSKAPYLRGELPVTTSERHVVVDYTRMGDDIREPRFGLIAASDDLDDPVTIALPQWKTREEAEEYARAQGMRLAVVLELETA